jgi:hypothetical protein
MSDPIISTVQVTYTLPISTYIHMFTPIVVPTLEASSVPTSSFDFMRYITSTAPIIATTFQMGTGTVVRYYFELRLAMTALLMAISWILKKLGYPTRQVTVMGRQYDMVKLPRIK